MKYMKSLTYIYQWSQGCQPSDWCGFIRYQKASYWVEDPLYFQREHIPYNLGAVDKVLEFLTERICIVRLLVVTLL